MISRPEPFLISEEATRRNHECPTMRKRGRQGMSSLYTAAPDGPGGGADDNTDADAESSSRVRLSQALVQTASWPSPVSGASSVLVSTAMATGRKRSGGYMVWLMERIAVPDCPPKMALMSASCEGVGCIAMLKSTMLPVKASPVTEFRGTRAGMIDAEVLGDQLD